MGAGYAKYTHEGQSVPSFQSFYSISEDDDIQGGPIHFIMDNSLIRKRLLGKLNEMAIPPLTLEIAKSQLPPDFEVPQKKDAKFSFLMRSKAEEFYQKNFTSEFYPFATGEALEATNVAILFAPASSEEYVAALATRSVVYFQKALYYEEDAKERLLKTGIYLEKDTHQMRELLECCLTDATVALASPEVSRRIENEMELQIGKIQMKLSQLADAEKLREEFKDTLKDESDFSAYPSEDFESPEEYADNALMPSMDLNDGHRIKVEWGETKGRSIVVTAEEVKKETTLFGEKPFASVLHREFENSHCSHCHKELRHSQFFPCLRCIDVKFCSPSCVTEADSSYHKFECGLLSLLHTNTEAHLALRIILTAGKDRVLRCCSGDKQLREGNGSTACLKDTVHLFNEESDGDDNEYLRILSLLDNIVVMDPKQVALHWLAAISFASLLLERTEFFKESHEEERVEEAAIVAGAILRHICQVICNSQQISQFDRRTDSIEMEGMINNLSGSPRKTVAIAIFPSACLVNHSCDPNVQFQFVEGNRLVVRTVKNLVYGDEVLTCYGPSFRNFPVMKRQEILRDSFFFVCRCEMCIQEMKSNFSFPDKFVCASNCMGPLFLVDGELYCGSCSDVSSLEALSFLTKKSELIKALLKSG